jgi:heme/copper-type cytochrome/quinol oxidase subunit 2
MPVWMIVTLIMIVALIVGVLVLMIATFSGMKTKRETGAMRGKRPSQRAPGGKNNKSRSHKSR